MELALGKMLAMEEEIILKTLEIKLKMELKMGNTCTISGMR